MNPKASAGRTSLVLLWLASWALAQETPLQSAETLEEVWQLVDQNFFDPAFRGVDWPAQREQHRGAAAACTTRDELAAIVNAMLAPLNSSHTAYFSQDDPRHYQLLGIFSSLVDGSNQDAYRYDGIGITTRVVDGKHFISGVFEGHPAQTAGLMYGDEIVAVDGQPLHPVLSFRGKAGQTVQLDIRRSGPTAPLQRVPVGVVPLDGRTMFETALDASARVIQHRGRRIGYLHVWSYAGEKYHARVQAYVLDGMLADCDALIVDLRDGWGGANVDYLRLFLPPLVQMQVPPRDGAVLNLSGVWERPVGLLVNSGSTSGKEVFTYAFQKLGRGPVVGTRTAGAVLAGRGFRLANGDVLYLAVADIEIDGQRLEGRGVAPTITVDRPLPYAQGADPQLERLLQALTP